MPVKKEVCRNFARGSCHFGQRCRFVHVNPKPPNNTNTNGTLFQQPKPHQNNPYGFGVQNASQPKGFENTWTRFSPNPTTATENHKCSDCDSCRRIMVDDFQNERPLWKLTCYGHWKGVPCDIPGDVSFEELRAAAYDDAKRGLAVHSIVDRERNLLNSKLVEFDNICKTGQSSQTPAPTPVSSFTQLGNTGFGMRFPAPLNNPFGGFGQQPINLPWATPVVGGSLGSGSDSASTPPARANEPSIREEVVVQANHMSSTQLPQIETVWLKDKWSPGEVPEDAPPDAVCS